MTEEQARKKWCCMSRVNNGSRNPISVNRYKDGDIHQGCLCVASDCAMWIPETSRIAKIETFRDIGIGLNIIPETIEKTIVSGGQCGLMPLQPEVYSQ